MSTFAEGSGKIESQDASMEEEAEESEEVEDNEEPESECAHVPQRKHMHCSQSSNLC